MRPDNNGLARDTYTGASTSIEVSHDVSISSNAFHPTPTVGEDSLSEAAQELSGWTYYQMGTRARHTRCEWASATCSIVSVGWCENEASHQRYHWVLLLGSYRGVSDLRYS